MGNSKICIIGGGGFIGTALRKYFFDRGNEVVIIGRSLNIRLLEGETYFSIAEYSYKQLEELFAGNEIEAIIDLAYTSIPNTSYNEPVKDFTENLNNVIHHLDFATAIGCRKYIYISSGGTVYGDSLSGIAFSEDAPNFPLSPYGITKMACERYVYMYYKLHRLPAIIIRPSNIYGPGQRPFRGQGLAATALGLALKGDPIHIFGSGSNVRDYLYIDDFCRGLMELIEKGTTGEIYNMGYGEGYSILELVNCIDSVIEKDGLTLKRKLQPDRPFDVHYNVLNIDKMSTDTGWKPQTTLEEGITSTWNWIKEYMATN